MHNNNDNMNKNSCTSVQTKQEHDIQEGVVDGVHVHQAGVLGRAWRQGRVRVEHPRGHEGGHRGGVEGVLQ